MISNVHRGRYLQQGRGLGGIFSSLFRILKPLISKGASTALKAGKYALKDADIKKAVKSVKKAAIKSGAKSIVTKLNPEGPNSHHNVVKAKKRLGAAQKIKQAHSKKQKFVNDNNIFS